jgi:molybdate transport system substrate-binding protein
MFIEMKYAIAALALSCAFTGGTRAAEIRACGARATSTILGEIGPEFERTTGHRISVSIDVAAAMARRFEAGEPCDLLLVIDNQLDGLIKRGKILAESRTVLARSGIGVEVRAGAPKPDIGSVEAFKRAVLEARSVAYLKEGASGVYLAGLFDRLGIAKAIEPKLTRPDTDIVSKLVAEGRIELGLVVVTQILTTPGVGVGGPLPAEIQSYLVFAAGVASNSPVREPALDLLRFMAGPRAARALRAQGMEPG